MNKINKYLCKELGGKKGYVDGWDISVFGLCITMASTFFGFVSTILGYTIINENVDGMNAEIVFTFIHFIVGFISLCTLFLIATIIVKILTHKFIVCPIVKKKEEKLP